MDGVQWCFRVVLNKKMNVKKYEAIYLYLFYKFNISQIKKKPLGKIGKIIYIIFSQKYDNEV